MSLFARGQLNEWLSANPLILGAAFLVLGLALAGSGVYSLRSGRATSKFGAVVEGGRAQVLAITRLVGGLFCLGFGLYKIVIGLS